MNNFKFTNYLKQLFLGKIFYVQCLTWIFSLLLLPSMSSLAQAPGHIWGRLVSEDINSGSRGKGVAMDNEGNVYIAGGSVRIIVAKLDQQGDYIWKKLFISSADSNNGMCQANGIKVDEDGNVYVVGTYTGTIDFDPGAGITSLVTAGRDIFILKLNNKGDFVWVKGIGAGTTGWDEAFALDLDNLSNVYVAGMFAGVADFDPGSGTFAMNSASGGGIFALKLTSNGDFVWAKQMGSSSGRAWSVKADNLGNVILAGMFSGTTSDFDPGPAVLNFRSAGGSDGFIVKLDNKGDLLWARQLGDISSDMVFSVNVDDIGNVFTTGAFVGMVDFDPATNVQNLVSRGGSDIFVMKYDINGSLIWVKQFGGAGSDNGQAICLDKAGNIYISGLFSLTANFNSDQDTFNLSTNGAQDVFVLKLNKEGSFEYAGGFGGFQKDEAWGIASDMNGNIAICGTMISPEMDIDPGEGVNMVRDMEWKYNHFVVKMGYCNTVTYLRYTPCDSISFNATTYKETGTYYDTLKNLTECDSIVVYNLEIGRSYDSTFNVAVCDSFEHYGIMRYASGLYADTFIASGPSGCDSVIKLNLTIAKYDRIEEVATCDSFLFGMRYYTNTGNYTEVFQSYIGCDSIVELKLTILGTSPVAHLTLDDKTLIANNAHSYQWLDCGQDYAVIPGATEQVFRPEENGSYAVLISNLEGCSDTSQCLEVKVGTRLQELYRPHFRIYPNPATDLVGIRSDRKGKSLSVCLTDMYGKTLLSQEHASAQDLTLSLQGLAAGMYILRVQQDEVSVKYKIIKQ